MLSITLVTSMATRSILILFLVINTSKVKADLVNVAIGKSTLQFGGEPPSKDIWPSSNAVDGIKECSAVTAKHYTLTATSHDPWWMVNLGDQFRMQEIIVHGRHDGVTSQLHGFRLYLSLNNSFDDNNIVYTNTDYNNGTIYITQNLTGVFRYVRLDLPDTFRGESLGGGKQTGPLVLCEVEVLVNMTNIALGKPASMSSVYGHMIADKSVDGNLRRDANTCNCCSHSQNEANPWLKINLLHSYKIYRITVLGRLDDNRDNRMLGGLEIYVDNSQNLAVGNNTIANNSVVTVSLPSGIIANNVVLKRPRRQGNSEWYLVVCEVKIYTTVLVCQAGTYIDYIENQCKGCGHCKTQPCNKDTGTCPGGACMAGWTGTVCNTACDDGFYGENCSHNCSRHCKGGEHQCNKVNGKCMQGCIDGYTGERCETGCHAPAFGKNCSLTCNTCNRNACRNTDGLCSNGCVPGYKPHNRYCNTSCDDGFYGPNCSHNCSGHCKGGIQQCNKINGKCMQGCIDGYMGEICGTECHAPAFGKNCSLTCNTCKGKTCRNTDGLCSDGCVPGYKPANLYCNTPCDAGSYGQNCSGSCSGHCLNGNGHCNTTDGACMTGCDRGYSGYRCETKCTSGFYGFGCNETCHHCINKTTCDFKSGNCPDGCKPGFEGNFCDKECQDGYFGDCTHRCHCKDDVPCSKTDGVCTENCTFGWGGKNCSIDLSLIRQLTHVVTNQTGMFETYDSSKAIDGKDRYDVNKCNCCSVTNGMVPSWWQIDLGDKYLIDAVKIYGRSDIGSNNDQLENATVYASNQTMVNNNVSQTFIYRIPTITTSTVSTHHLNISTIAQFFIVKSVKMILVICEFKLFKKVCDFGKFGTGCSHTCHCSDNKSCDSITGKCEEPGCFPGWRGESCHLKCGAESFGPGCNKRCNCINKTACNYADGKCAIPACEPGWTGDACDKVCDVGKFGTGCSHTCHCFDNKSCDSITGKCKEPGCFPGWRGESCNLKCGAGSFGPGCNKRCNCINKTACNYADGKCAIPACEPGWTGDACDKDGNILRFLKNEIKTSMSTVAGNWTSDRAVDGDTGPDPNKCQCCSGTTNAHLSWWMVDLGQSVPVKGISIYSRNNEEDYRQLVGFQVVLSNRNVYNTSSVLYKGSGDFSSIYEMNFPNVLTRFIKVQRPGLLTLCEVKVFQGVCNKGRFGRECEHECHCADNKQCDQNTGYCQFHACKTGWQGLACNKTCPLDTFGDNCSDSCYCAEGTCTNNYGICPGECRQGYHGPHCNQVGSEMKSRAAIWGAVGSIGALLIIAVIIGVVVLYVRRKRRASGQNEYETPNLYVTPTEIQEYDTIENINGSEHSNRIADGNEKDTDL